MTRIIGVRLAAGRAAPLALGALAVALGLAPSLAAEPTAADREVETFLLEATIAEDKPLGQGITGARKWRLEQDGVTRVAVFKTVDEYRAGNLRTTDMGFTANFSDSYKFDRAAYLLDRRLGLGRVPVVVVRSKNGVAGAVIEWIDGCVDEGARVEGEGPEMTRRTVDLQQSLMKLFDSLIHNDDRNLGNQLWCEDGVMRWIDHSRAFRTTKDVQAGFLNNPARLTRAVHEALKSLDQAELEGMLGDLMSKKRIKAILARRDKILEKVDADLAAYGELAVYAVEELER